MTARHLVLIAALVQGAFLAALLLLIVLNRWWRLARRATVHPLREAAERELRRWAAGDTGVDAVAAALVPLPPPIAIEQLAAWSSRVPQDRWPALAHALSQARWGAKLRRGARSRRWWKRLQSARFLAAAGLPGDVPTLARLIRDPHPAVHLAAVSSLNHVNSAELAEAAIDQLPVLPIHVGMYFAMALRRGRQVAVPLFDRRLTEVDDPALPRIAEYAARLQEPSLRPRFTALAKHPNKEVRAQAARALGALPHAESQTALLSLLNDEAWVVRAQAARGLGLLTAAQAVPGLRKALRDPEWWVRLRAALALTRFGGAGRDALLQEERGPDPGARNVTELVLGLSPQALAEYAT